MLGTDTEHVLVLVGAVFVPIAVILVIVVVILAASGASFGIRRRYVSCLLRIFEWGATQGNVHVPAEDSLADDVTTELPKPLPRCTSSKSIIYRETTSGSECANEERVSSRGWATIADSLDFMKAGMEAIIEDEVTNRFEAEQLVSWNMLTRTSLSFNRGVSWQLTCMWMAGFVLRYTILLPMRLILFGTGLTFMVTSMAVVGLFPAGPLKRRLNEQCLLCSHRILARSVSALIYFHDPHNKARSAGICVANHTSPMDVMVLGTDNAYALIGQKHSGLLGVMQQALSRASAHIWFERGETRDRALVTAKMRDHVLNSDNLPILIFPEGTCVNNTSVMMFKKGSFEVGTTVYPIAMKYDSRFGDAFWNSSEQGWFEYIMHTMTSWAIICHVWYLPPMHRKLDEGAVEFANRVKKAIALCGGLLDLEWDGGLKRAKVPGKMRTDQQHMYFQRFAHYYSFSEDSKDDDSSSCQESERF